MKRFSDMSIGSRLSAGFGAVVALLVVLAIVGYSRMALIEEQVQKFARENIVKTMLTADVRDIVNDQAIAVRNLGLVTDDDDNREQAKRITENWVRLDDTVAKLEPMLVSEAGKAAMGRLKTDLATFRRTVDKAAALGNANKNAEAIKVTFEEVRPAQRRALTEVGNLIVSQKKLNESDLVAAEAAFTTATWVMWSIAAFAVVLAALFGWIITRSITRPVGEAMSVAQSIAKGQLDVAITVEAQDETGRLLAAMRDMVGVLKAFERAQAEIAQKHEAGEIDHLMPAASFAGAYGVMAQQTNDLVQSHIKVKMRVVEVVKRYALGDMQLDMDRLPGKKAQITQAIDEVKASLQNVNGEIKKLVNAAVAGDFSVRSDASKLQYEFREMVDGLNKLMDVSDRGLSDVARVLKALQAGNLTQRIDSSYQGMFDALKQDANATVDNLRRLVGEIRESALSIASSSEEIAVGNADLSSRTEEQASSLEETASSMEELTATVKQNAESAKQANQLAVSASDVAVRGGEVVGEVVTTMESITASSKKIADIIGVIDGIAFQTNILALNAAVEAARAGEQGRGFAVVASEVRNLAQRSAGAAKEIKGLISDSVEKVESGSKLVDAAGKTMEEIVASVKRVTDIMSEITAASLEQSSGIEQVNQAVVQMDQVTQQNAALVEEAAAAAESLKEQAGGLTQSVSVFVMDANGQPARASDGGFVERRSPNRAKNVERLPATKAKAGALAAKPAAKPAAEPRRAAAAGGHDEWKEF